MEYLFPEMEEQNRRTLYIIGNGFDLASDIASSYSDFYQWLKGTNKDSLINMSCIFWGQSQNLWSDLEMALGEYDEQHILEFCSPNEEFDYDHPTRSMAAIEDGPDWIFLPIMNELIEAFNDWVDSINISIANPINNFPFPKESTYLTFNYTETLESVYSIPQSNVLHIHGSRLLGRPYVMGHNNFRDPNNEWADDYGMFYIQDTKSKIIEWMNTLLKDTTKVIHNNQNFFQSLSNIEQVIVYGHSLNEVDWPYMKEIVNNIGLDKQWRISQHSNEDSKRIDSFIREIELNNVIKFDI
jgi:hypothetical protein